MQSTTNHMTRSLPRPLSILKILVFLFIPQTNSIALTRLRLPKKDGLLDWDCAEALNIPEITKSLAYIQKTGTFPVSQQNLYERFRFNFNLLRSVFLTHTPLARSQFKRRQELSWRNTRL
jgi:hypothetical protein